MLKDSVKLKAKCRETGTKVIVIGIMVFVTAVTMQKIVGHRD